MEILIVYYSRTNTTKKVAEALQQRLQCDIEEIIDTKNRNGIIGWIRSGRDAMRKTLTKIADVKHDPAEYDLVIIGTPVWTGTMTPAIRTYLASYKNKLKQAAFFTTQGGAKRQKVFDDMYELADIKPKAESYFIAKKVKSGQFEEKFIQFINDISK